jgi:hypothetical protein
MALFKSTWTSAPQAADIESDTGVDFMKQIQPKFTDKNFYDQGSSSTDPPRAEPAGNG